MAEKKENKKEVLVLLDSHAILHRAYHALPPSLTAPDGSPTNALYGFSAFLIRVLKELKPDYIVAAYDLPEPTFRHIAYKEYKAQRKKTDNDLISQIIKSKEILRAFKIPVFEFSGFEADDVLGTMVQKLENEKKLKTIIASGDMDTLQLVKGDETVVYTLKKGINDTTIYNEENVKTRFGFLPRLIPDYKGLCGDKSDNILGVKGVGEKSAENLIQKFGDLEKIYEILEKDEKRFEKEGIKKRIIEFLKEHKEDAFMSKELALIRRDAPIDFSLELVKNEERPKKENLIKIFEELGFKSLIARLDEAAYFFKNGSNNESQDENRDKNYESSLFNSNSFVEQRGLTNGIKKEIEKQDEIFWIFENQKKTADKKSKDKIESEVIMVFKNGSYFRLQKNDFEKEKDFFGRIFKKGKHYSYKAKELYHFFENIGILPKFDFDIALSVWLLNSKLNNPSLIQIFQLVQLYSPQVLGTVVYAEKDYYEKIFEAKDIILNKIEEEGLSFVLNKIEMPLISALKEMEQNGILFDEKKLKEISKFSQKELERLKKNIWDLAGEEFNINSTKELRRVLFEKLGLDTKGVRKTGGGARSTKFSELMKMKDKHIIIKEIIAYRELAKLKSTYINALPSFALKDGRIHTVFNQTGTSTGRLSSSNPNLQNIPVKSELGKKIREAFVAERGSKLVSFDYSQVELRVVAYLSKDEKMLSAFRENKDIHSITASEIFNTPLQDITSEMRRKAKVINFGILYGMGISALSESLKISKQEAESYRNEYFNDFYGITEYIKNTIQEAREIGYVKTFFGRKRHLEELLSFNEMLKREAERMAVNMPVQGTSADIIKLAMVEIYKFLSLNKQFKNKVKMILQIHDELLFEIKEDVLDEAVKKIKNIMENAPACSADRASEKIKDIAFPVEAKISDSWS